MDSDEPDKALLAAREAGGVDVAVLDNDPDAMVGAGLIRRDPLLSALPIAITAQTERFQVLAKSDPRIQLVSATATAAELTKAVADVVQTSAGEYRCANVVLAIGRRGTPRKLGVPGEEQAKVVYRLVDAQQYDGQHVLVVGGGDSALEAAVALSAQPGTHVTIAYRSAAFNRVKPANRERLAAAEAQGRLTALLETSIRHVGERDVALERAGQPITLKNDAVIACLGGELPFDLLRKIGISFETKRGTA
jgi:thioredoxin reductase